MAGANGDSDDDGIDEEGYDPDETAALLSQSSRGAGLRFRGRKPILGLSTGSGGSVSGSRRSSEVTLMHVRKVEVEQLT